MNKTVNKLKTLAVILLAAFCVFSFGTAASLLYNSGRAFAEETTDAVLDMDGTEASLEAAGGVNNNVDNALGVGGLEWGIFPEATGATKMQFTAEQVAVGDGVTIRFGKSYKAADILFLKVRMATNGGSDAVTEAYSLTDTENKTSAGTLASGSGVQNHDLYLEPSVLADEEGNIGGFYLKRVSGTDASYYYFDYVELRTNATGFDMDGVEASIEAEGGVTVRADNTFNKSGALDWGIFPEATGATKLSRTEGEIAVGGTVTVKLSFPVKAEEGKAIKVRMATETFACVLQGYALTDTSFEHSAVVGQKTSDQGVSNFELVMYSEILADADGYVRGFVIKNTSGAAGRMDFDYVSVVDSATITKTMYDMDGIEATITADGEVQTHADNTFNTTLPWGIFPEATGATKLMRTAGGIAEGASFKIILSTPIKAKDGKVIKVRLASEGVSGVTEGYALSDTEFVESAGKVASWNCIQNLNLYLDPAVLADVDGYIRGVTIRRTSGASVVYDIDYVEVADIADLKLDMNLSEAWFEFGGTKITNNTEDNNAALPIFSGGDGSTKITWTENIAVGESFDVKFGQKIAASLYPYIKFRVAVGNWPAEGEETGTIISEIFSLEGNSAGTYTTGGGNFVDTFVINTASLADENGFVGGFTVKKVSGRTGQYFADYVECMAAKNLDVTVIDGADTEVKSILYGNEFKLSEIEAADTDTQALLGFKINGKLYSKDYSFAVTEACTVEAVRISFKMRVGAMIRMGEISGLRFIVDLSESEYNALVALVGEGNASLGISMTKKSTGKTVDKVAENRYVDGNGNIVWCAVVTDIPVEGYKTAFASQAYISVKFEDKSEATKVYAIEDDNNRSIYEVAAKALEIGGLSEEQRAFCEDIVTKADEYAQAIAAINLPDYDAKENELSVVTAGWLIPKSLNSTNAQWIKDAGINVMHAVAAGDDDTLYFDSYDDAAKAALKILNDSGVKVYVNVNSRSASAFNKISSFKADAAVLGMSLDEPTKAEITDMASVVESYNLNAGGKTFFSNLFPSFASTVKNDFGNIFTTTKNKYKSYLSYYCDNVLNKLTTGEKWLSVDRYLLTYDKNGAKCLDTGWLSDVESVATVARSYTGVKTNFFVQTMPYGANNGVGLGNAEGSHDRVPTYEDIRLQEYALMAFGYDGMSMFCYGTPVVYGDFASTQYGMIDRSGNKTTIYDAVKRANNEILAFDHVLLQFDWQGVFTNDAGKTTTGSSSTSNSSFKNITRLSLSSVPSLNKVYSTADTLFGYFKDEAGNDGIMAVNYNETSQNLSDTVRLGFDGTKYNKALCYIGGQKVVKSLSDGVLELNLGAGEGVFVIPYAA